MSDSDPTDARQDALLEACQLREDRALFQLLDSTYGPDVVMAARVAERLFGRADALLVIEGVLRVGTIACWGRVAIGFVEDGARMVIRVVVPFRTATEQERREYAALEIGTAVPKDLEGSRERETWEVGDEIALSGGYWSKVGK